MHWQRRSWRGPLPKAAKPETVGLSSQRLQRLTDAFNADVQSGKIPGAVVMVVRQGKVAYSQSFGFQDRAANSTMRADSIFRIASMTKPITIVAALMLAEEGKLQIMDPASVYLPQLKNLQVGVEVKEGNGERRLALEPARREITVQDLMRHTSGMTYGIFGDSLVQRAYRAAGTMDDQQTNAQMIDKLAQLAAGVPAGRRVRVQHVQRRGRPDRGSAERPGFESIHRRAHRQAARYAGHHVPARHASKQRDWHRRQTAPGAPPLIIGYNPAKPPKWFSGGGGLLSTAEDYARFGQMLLNGGELDGVRVLSRKSVELMTSNHLPPDATYGAFTLELGLTAPLPQYGQGYGLGVGVRKEAGRSMVPGSVGDYYWGGATGPYFWVDPQEKLVAVMMLQASDIQLRTHYRSLLRNLVYQALQ